MSRKRLVYPTRNETKVRLNRSAPRALPSAVRPVLRSSVSRFGHLTVNSPDPDPLGLKSLFARGARPTASRTPGMPEVAFEEHHDCRRCERDELFDCGARGCPMPRRPT